VFSIRKSLAFLFSAALVAVPAFASRTTHKTTANSAHRTPSTSHSRGVHKGRAAAKTHKLHGQQAIDAARVTEIQQALIREHYMSGEANGNWDAGTQAAMQKYQSDQGWQTRLMPDSRALKKLGLGPDYSTAINAEGASFAAPAPANTIPPAQAAGFAAAAGVNQ
jgi:peptidoglycan hydrolase-like protein with peptidoglycan-binding domain